MRAESSLGCPPTRSTETTASPGPLAPVVTGRPLSPLESAAAGARSAPSGLAGWRRGPGRGARRVSGRDRASPEEPPPATPAGPAGVDTPVSPGLSNCLALQAPCPETAAGTGRGGVWWAELSARSPMGWNSGFGGSGRPPARSLAAPHGPQECGSLSGRWGARGTHSQGRAGRARRGSRWDRSDRRRRAWLGVLNADRAGGGEGDTPLCLEARSGRQSRSWMVAADLCPKPHRLRIRVRQAGGAGLTPQRS